MKLSFLSHPRTIQIVIGFIATLFYVWMISSENYLFKNITDKIDHIVYDSRMNYFLSKKNIKEFPIAIVDIDEKSLGKHGRWPWSRKLVAKLTTTLAEKGATVIAFDMIFSEPELNNVSAVLNEINTNVNENAQVIAKLKNIENAFNSDAAFSKTLLQKEGVLGFILDSQQRKSFGMLPEPLLTLNTALQKKLPISIMTSYTANLPALQQAAKHGGFLTIIPDGDGVMRRAPLLLRYGDKIYPSLALEATRLYMLLNKLDLHINNDNGFPVLEGIQFGDYVIPTDTSGKMLIPYFGAAKSIPTYSVADVFSDTLVKDAFVGKLVFLGSSALGLGDLKPTPVQSIFPGLEIQATIAASILMKIFVYQPHWTMDIQIILIIAIGFLLTFILPFVSSTKSILLGVLLFILAIACDFYLWFKYGIDFPVFVLLSLIFYLTAFDIIYSYILERRQKAQITSMFEEYVPPEYIKIMLKKSDTFGLSGENKVMTVLFSDIVNFTVISEKLTVEQIKNMLNIYLTKVTGDIFNFGGTIDKYVGDMIVAFWNAPLSDEKHSQHAINAAIAMQKSLKEIYPLLQQNGLPTFKIGIGINTGMMNVGDMGSKYRKNYTVLGDSVNLGSRLEALTRFYKVDIIISENSCVAIDNVYFRKLDKIRVKGKLEPIVIFEPLSVPEDSDDKEKLIAELDIWNDFLSLYYQAEWIKAKETIDHLIEINPELRLYQIYLDRVLHFQSNDKQANWDGVWEFTTKH